MIDYSRVPFYEVEVEFKPRNIDPWEATDFRSVEFKVQNEKSRSEYYEIADKKVVENNIISSHGLEYWEPYRVHIDCPSQRPVPPIIR